MREFYELAAQFLNMRRSLAYIKFDRKISKEIFDNAYKFLIVLENNRNAIKNLEKNLNKCNNRYSFNYIDNIDWGNFIKGKINVVFINLNKN